MKKIITLLMTLIIIFTMTACSTSASAGVINSTTVAGVAHGSAVTSEVVSTASESIAATVSDAAETETQSSSATGSVAVALAENSTIHDEAEDYAWESTETISIALDGNSITVDGEGVTVDGSQATITSAGTYCLSGSLADGQIIVNTEDAEVVRLILNGVDLQSSTSAPIYIVNAEETVIILADTTENTITDGTTYVFEAADVDEPNAAIFSMSDLTISGNGSLTVKGNFNDGIASKDGLIIASGTITVNSVDDGIRGKDYLVVKDGNITVNAQGDGLKSDK
jgi:hypothetical protein